MFVKWAFVDGHGCRWQVAISFFDGELEPELCETIEKGECVRGESDRVACGLFVVLGGALFWVFATVLQLAP